MIRTQNALEQACLSEFTPPISVNRPLELKSPFIFCSPHSGHHYPADFISRSHYPLSHLRQNEDAFIDTLFAPVARQGAPLLAALFPRCFVDVNRAADELPPAWLPRDGTPTLRAAAGLGVIPVALAEGLPIYKRKLKPAVIEPRLKALYHPYHDALKRLIEEMKTHFGHAVIIDCHSMPGFSPSRVRRADVVLGDRYGTSCHPETIALLERLFTEREYSVTRNHPYAGSYVTSHYGQPTNGVQAVQIEINRDLYLNPVTLKPKRGYERLEADIKAITEELILSGSAQNLIAAE
ncbi:MAG: N-formylglutamate amidohydrolase [Alphaproteobacteria bacterium]